MKTHYIITTIIYFILVATIIAQNRYYSNRVYAVAQGSYYLGCVNGLSQIYQYVRDPATPATTECAQLTGGQDYKKIVRLIDVMSKGKTK